MPINAVADLPSRRAEVYKPSFSIFFKIGRNALKYFLAIICSPVTFGCVPSLVSVEGLNPPRRFTTTIFTPAFFWSLAAALIALPRPDINWLAIASGGLTTHGVGTARPDAAHDLQRLNQEEGR